MDTYDPAGNKLQEQRTLDGYTYTSSWTYDTQNRVSTATDPDGDIVSTSYGPSGLLSSRSSSTVGTLVQRVSYNALRQPTSYQVGAGSTVSRSYWGLDQALPAPPPQGPGTPFGALFQTQWTAPGGQTLLFLRQLGYDAVGNVLQVQDGVNGETLLYRYDAQNRLSTTTLQQGQNNPQPLEDDEYDALGNLTTHTPLVLSYPAAQQPHPHAVQSTNTGVSYGYDANGSLVSRGSQSISYDPRRLPVRLQEAGVQQWRAAYDGDGTRRKRIDANGTVHYLSATDERRVGPGAANGDSRTKYYTACGQTVGLRTYTPGVSSSTVWLITDHLGGTALVTNTSFGTGPQMRYLPFGLGRDDPTAMAAYTDHQFTGQVVDLSTSANGAPLSWYGSRAYDPGLGRFCCPDTLVPDHPKSNTSRHPHQQKNPQHLNRYSYALNNPVRLRDPSGHRAQSFGPPPPAPSGPYAFPGAYQVMLANEFGYSPSASGYALSLAAMGGPGLSPGNGIIFYFSGVGGDLSQEEWGFVADLQQDTGDDMVVEAPFAGGAPFPLGTQAVGSVHVGTDATSPESDVAALSTASLIENLVQQGAIRPGETINFVTVSGGTQTGLDVGAILASRPQDAGISIANFVSIGGVAFSGKPANIGEWTDISSARDTTNWILGNPRRLYVNDVDKHEDYFAPQYIHEVEQSVVGVLSGSP